jgi:hypothetical protein
MEQEIICASVHIEGVGLVGELDEQANLPYT